VADRVNKFWKGAPEDLRRRIMDTDCLYHPTLVRWAASFSETFFRTPRGMEWLERVAREGA
jgi:hypothetical protein